MKNLNQLDHLMTCYLDQNAPGDARAHEWGRRAVLQMMFAVKLVEANAGLPAEVVEAAVDQAYQAYAENGALTRETCLQVECQLAPLADVAKSYTLLCIGHAHIDMNWMWSYDETVSITLDTFRTVLKLMEEYPEFTYAQSQASVYEIVAIHDPQMLEQIKQRVHEGRWEVTASTWVEADRNMPNAESMARHFLYTRRYLAELLEIDPESLDLDYEPDTFGHHANVPEVLCDAGIKYYYHCRGADGPYLYRWQAPSGRQITVCREPLWYNWEPDGRCAMIVPELCRISGMKTALRVYGVGDHGGGPTRRDLESILDMNTWPVFPNYRFGTYHEFFHNVSQVAEQLPVVQGELNFIFDGCYTTQTRIKRGNRQSEQSLHTAETAAALAHFAIGEPYPVAAFEKAWKKVLFNQFHDILPGSGTTDTREHAMANYQEAFALSNTQQMKSLRALAARIDTSSLELAQDRRWSRSEGAGVGYPTALGSLPRTAWQTGKRRLFMVWNALAFEREQTCELTLWDWPGDSQRIQVRDGYGQVLPHQVLDSGKNPYWGHRYLNILVAVQVPAAGYRTIVVDELPQQQFAVKAHDVRTIKPVSHVLENEYLRIEISAQDATILSFVDKETARDFACPGKPAGVFRLIKEDPSRGMTAWIVGAYQEISSLHTSVKFTENVAGPLCRKISWTASFGNRSRLNVTLMLHRGERLLRLQADVQWQEIGNKEDGLPQLNFYLPLTGKQPSYRYSIPMGEIQRPALPHDVPATAYALASFPEAGKSLMLVSDSKYGFRGTDDGLAMTLIRSSIDPDPWPEVGAHQIRLGIGLVDDDLTKPGQTALAGNTPLLAVPLQSGHQGNRPLQASLFSLRGDGVFVSAIKAAEQGNAMVVRLYSQSSQPEVAHLSFWEKPARAMLTDLLEQLLPDAVNQPEINGPAVRVVVPPFSLLNVRLEW